MLKWFQSPKVQTAKLVTGLVMVVACLTLVCLFYFKAFHYKWWSENTYFLVLTIVSVFCALVGGFLVQSYFFRGGHRENFFFEILTYLGFMMVLAGLVLGGAALLVAMDVNTNTGVGVDMFGMPTGPVFDKELHYPEDFLVMDSQVLMLCFSILTMIFGQLFIGVSKNRRYG
jgi:hypothetical protein